MSSAFHYQTSTIPSRLLCVAQLQGEALWLVSYLAFEEAWAAEVPEVLEQFIVEVSQEPRVSVVVGKASEVLVVPIGSIAGSRVCKGT